MIGGGQWLHSLGRQQQQQPQGCNTFKLVSWMSIAPNPENRTRRGFDRFDRGGGRPVEATRGFGVPMWTSAGVNSSAPLVMHLMISDAC